MNKEFKKKLFLGILVSTGSILFIVGIFFIGRKESLFTPTVNISAIFNEINGLREGDFVRYSGVKVGVVEKIVFLNDSMIQVKMKIEKKMQPYIKKDAVAHIATEGLVGNKLINLHSKHTSRQTISENEILISIAPYNTQQIIEKLMSTNTNAEIITNNLAAVSKRMMEEKGIFEMIFSDDKAANDLKTIIERVKTSSQHLQEISNNIEKMIRKINSGEGLASTILNDTSLTKELKQTLRNLELSSEYSRTITKQIDQSLQKGDSGTLGMLMKDSVFAESIRQSIQNFHEASEKLNHTLDAVQNSYLLKRLSKEKK